MIVGSLAREHSDAAARVLSVSFHDYPYMRYVLERSAEDYEAAAKQGRPEAAHHYLGMLGVLPEAQGAGHGGLLVARVKELARGLSTSTGVCLNTETARNVALYEHLGFDVVGEGDAGDLHTWCMFWRPSENSR